MGEDGTAIDVDWEGLAVAVENQLPTSHSFLNLSTGRVMTIQGSDGRQPEPPEGSGGWVRIPPRPSREGYQTMQRFVEQLDELDDRELREKLGAALVGRGAFRRFKDQLLDVQERRQEWFAFKDADVYVYITRWLEREGIAWHGPPPSGSSRSRFSAAVRRSAAPRPCMGEVPAQAGDEAEPDWKAVIAPFDRPELMFHPTRTALVVIDVQRIFVDPLGSSYLPMATAACERLAGLVEAWRQAGRPLIFTRHAHRDPRQDGGAMSRWWRSLIMEGSPEAELVDALRPAAGERVITKSRYSAFAFTELEMVLRSLGIEDLLIGGVLTNLCCETTAREAFVRDFNVFFLGDGTAAADPALHLASLRNIAYGFGRVLSVAEARARVS